MVILEGTCRYVLAYSFWVFLWWCGNHFLVRCFVVWVLFSSIFCFTLLGDCTHLQQQETGRYNTQVIVTALLIYNWHGDKLFSPKLKLHFVYSIRARRHFQRCLFTVSQWPVLQLALVTCILPTVSNCSFLDFLHFTVKPGKHEHLKYFRNVYCVMTSYSKDQPRLFNLCPVDNAVDFPNTCPLDSDLSSG